MTTEPSSTYFDIARSWADERDRAGAKSRRIAWTIALVACAVALLEAVALALAMPLKTVEPIAVLVDRTTGNVQRVDLNQPQLLAANEALQQSLLAQYVTAREGFDPVSIRQNYRKVALWSDAQARSSYVAGMAQNPPAARLAQGRRDIALAVQIKSVSMLSGGTALVRFDVARIGYDGQRSDVRPYVATMAFGYRGQPMRIEDRFDNPLGFVVQRYRVDAEAPPPAAGAVS